LDRRYIEVYLTKKQYYFYKKLTGWAMQLLKEEMTDTAAMVFLMNAVNNLFNQHKKIPLSRDFFSSMKLLDRTNCLWVCCMTETKMKIFIFLSLAVRAGCPAL
jgi:hypothetical protein